MREEEFVALPAYRRKARKLQLSEDKHCNSYDSSENMEEWIEELGDLVDEE